jgi:predicted RecA/RadA family phage recombinase
MAEALTQHEQGFVRFDAGGVTYASGEVIQLGDGRAGVVQGLNPTDSWLAARTQGVVKLTLVASTNVLKGGRVFWNRQFSSATPLESSGDFFVGVAAEDAVAGDTYVRVDLNRLPVYDVELIAGTFTEEATLGLGVTNSGGVIGPVIPKLAFDAVAEIAQAAILSDGSVPVADGPIFEGRIAVFDIGDNAALDINWGLANASHGTNADSITESAFFHLDGNALDVKAESDDGTTEVNATDTTVDAVDDAYAEYWIDARVLTNVKFYIDGVRVLSATTFKLNAATGPLKALVHIEKTSDDTLADVRVKRLTLRATDMVT